MENFDAVLEELKETLDSYQQIRDTAYRQYSNLVSSVIHDRITEECQIERIMDGLLDFCDEDRFVEIYRKLCRHIFYRYPQMVGEHIAIFRMQFECGEE